MKVQNKEINKAVVEKKQDSSLVGLLSNLNPVGLQTVLNVIVEECGEIRLDNEARKVACEELGIDMGTAQGWQTASDIVKHVDLSLLCDKYPEAAKSILITILGALSAVCPPISVAAGIASVIPTETLAKAMGLSLKVSPDHIAHVIADYCTKKKRETLREYAMEEETLDGMKNLVVVCRDDLLFDQIKKLVESNDDEESSVVGTKDGTVRIIRWNEDKWADRYSLNNIAEKVLVIGDVKSVKNQPSLMEAKCDEFGIKYGWIGNIAYISANRQDLRTRTVYSEFSEALNKLEVPDNVKKDKTFRINIKTGVKAALFAPILLKDAYDDVASVLRQQYFYGAFKFYYSDLEQFLNE